MTATPRRIENVQTDRGSLPVYATGTVEQPWDSYSASDHAVWQQLYKRQREILPGRASDAFLRAQDGMGMTPGRKKFFQNVSSSPEENEILKQLIAKGIKVEIQIIPAQKKVDVASLLK